MIIFGFGYKKVKRLGTSGLRNCPRCHNTSEWRIDEQKSYFTLFFIPIFAYRTELISSCPVCREGHLIHKDELAQFLISPL